MPGYLRHRVLASDTLRGLALKYLGGHGSWSDIASLNNLSPADYDLVGVKELLIPIDVGTGTRGDDPLLSDLAVIDGVLSFDDRGGAVERSGLNNYIASLLRALSTNLLDTVFHPEYGLDLDRCVGLAGTPLFLRFLRLEVERVIRRDPRTADVLKVTIKQKPGLRWIQIGASVRPVGTTDTIELLVDRSA